MGRGRKRKLRRAEAGYRERGRGSETRSAPNDQTFMSRAMLDNLWKDGRCRHPEPRSAAYGLAISLHCDDCGLAMTFKLRFGRPKTFDVTIGDGGSHPQDVGRARVRVTEKFIFGNATQLMLPDGGADPEGGCPVRDETMLMLLMDLLSRGQRDQLLREPKKDFMAAWSGLDCDHGRVLSQAYRDRLGMWCEDCGAHLKFVQIGDKFITEMSRSPAESVMYGPHDASEVAGAIRKYAKEMLLPSMMADRMSDDPERDAVRLAKTMDMLVGRGLVRRTSLPDQTYTRLAGQVSAAVCGRGEFEAMCAVMEPKLERNGAKFTEHGKPVGAKYMLERARVSWPHWFEGVGLKVDPFDPDGAAQHCVKCGFSTLDDDVGDEHWSRGCPECGYKGYLIGVG